MRTGAAALIGSLIVAAPAAAFQPDSLDAELYANLPDRYQHLLEMSPLKPIPTYIELDEQQAATVPMYAPGDPLYIYLNRWGGTFYGGADDSKTNTSSIVNTSQATVSPFTGSESQWTDVRECVTDLFSRFNVVITDVEPTTVDYVEAVVAGYPDEIGMPWGVGGVAPYDPFSCQVIPDSIVYAFAGVYVDNGQGSARSLCETTAQEIAHAFGLDHQLLCEDPMTYLDGCGAKEFQDVYSVCGEFEERECSCNRQTQNSVQEMYEKLGPTEGFEPPPPPNDVEAPKVAILSPADGSSHVGDGTVEIVATATDDIDLVNVELYWEYNDIAVPCPGQGQGWSCTVDGATHTWQVAVGLGTRKFQVRARDVMGKSSETDMYSIWLSEDGSPAPEDNYPPEVRVVSPDEAAVLPANSEIQVVVEASDDTGIAQVELNWDSPGGTRAFPCPMDSRYVTCEENGSTYIWTLTVGDGARYFSVTATDLLGNQVETQQQYFTLANGVEPAAELSNDTFDLASELSCGDSVRLNTNPGEEDWFSIATPEDGQRVSVSVSGDVSDDLQVTAATGPHSSQVAADADGAPSLVIEPGADNEDVRVRVRPRTESGEYLLEVNCFEPFDPSTMYQPPAAMGCSSSGDADAAPPTGLSLLALFSLTLSFARRRKNKQS